MNRLAQFGGGLLPVVAAAGVVMVMTQGALFYKSKSSAQFLSGERNKIMAQQVAEAGVENTIAEIGSRRVTVTENMSDHVVASDIQVGNGAFTTTLTTLAMGASGDTVNLVSTGSVSERFKTIQAKLRLRNVYDSSDRITAISAPDTDFVIANTTVYDSTRTITVQDPNTMPAINATAAYAACMASPGNRCRICHIPPGNPANMHVIEVAKPAIVNAHLPHHGDYVTTDGTCDIYLPDTNYVVTSHIRFDTTLNITTTITYDTTVAIDTTVKVQILSWR
jgi:hypothetical protein